MVPLGSSQREGTLVKSYTALTQNMFKHLAHGEEVQYGTFRVKTVDDKIIVRGVFQDGREKEWRAWRSGPSPEIKKSYAAEDVVELLVDSVLADPGLEDSVLAEPLLSLG